MNILNDVFIFVINYIYRIMAKWVLWNFAFVTNNMSDLYNYVPQIDTYIPQIDTHIPQIDTRIPQIDTHIHHDRTLFDYFTFYNVPVDELMSAIDESAVTVNEHVSIDDTQVSFSGLKNTVLVEEIDEYPYQTRLVPTTSDNILEQIEHT